MRQVSFNEANGTERDNAFVGSGVFIGKHRIVCDHAEACFGIALDRIDLVTCFCGMEIDLSERFRLIGFNKEVVERDRVRIIIVAGKSEDARGPFTQYCERFFVRKLLFASAHWSEHRNPFLWRVDIACIIRIVPNALGKCSSVHHLCHLQRDAK